MQALLPAMAQSLRAHGWQIAATPLLGIGQAWSGPYGDGYYQPGLSRHQMLIQAGAFCAFGAQSIGWYAWDDSGFGPKTQTPNNSPTIAAGIRDGITVCRTIWKA